MVTGEDKGRNFAVVLYVIFGGMLFGFVIGEPTLSVIGIVGLIGTTVLRRRGKDA